MEGPPARRWERLALHWWRTNKGPVEGGKRVAHMDGDTMNDDPANYGLVDAGDILFLAGLRDPGMLERNRRSCGRGAAAFNSMRARIRRLSAWNMNRWYVADLARRVIFNVPHKEGWQAYASRGVPVSAATARYKHSAALGWPDVARLDAAVLAALAEHGALRSPQLYEHVAAIYGARLWVVPVASQLSTALWRLRRRGFIASNRRGARASEHAVLGHALALRAGPTTLTVVEGSRIAASAFAGFTRVDETGRPYERATARASALQELLQSTA